MSPDRFPIRIIGLLLIWLWSFHTGNSQTARTADSAVLSNDWFNRGTDYLICREWTPALEAFRTALRFAPYEIQQASIYQNLGALYFLLADYQKAAIHFDYALQLINREPSAYSMRAEICLNLGFTWLERALPEKAKWWFDLAAKCNLRHSYRWNLRLALGTGNVLFALGSYREAITTFTKALIDSNLTSMVSEEEIWILKNLAWSLQAIGKPDSARLILDQATDWNRRTQRADQFLIGAIQLQKGFLLRVAGDYEEALEVLDSALDQLDLEYLVPEKPETLSMQLKTVDVLRYSILCEKIQTQWCMFNRRGKDTSILHRLYEQTLIALQLGEVLINNPRLKELISMQPDLQRSLTGIALELLMQLNDKSCWLTNEFVWIVERLACFEASCQYVGEISGRNLSDTLQPNLFGLKQQLFLLHKKRILECTDETLLRQEPDGEGIRLLEKLYSFDQARLNQIEYTSATGLTCRNCEPSFDLSKIPSLLNQNEVLIKYLIVDTTLYTILFSTDTTIILKQLSGSNIASEVQACTKAMKGLDPPAFLQSSTHLYNYLMRPVEEHLKSKFLLQIIPDRQLRELPFDALVVDQHISSGSWGNFLISQYETTCFTSISAWVERQMRFADSSAEREYSYDFVFCAPEFFGSGANALPFAIREVDEIGNLFISKRKRVRSFAGKGLHLDSLLALGGQSRIFHLATHGYKDPDHYEFSGWMMSGEPAPSPAISNTTNRIELGALQSFRMESDLVVMSSCSIGADPGNSWYKMIGFPNNFFHAGVRNMLFSLWDVSDKHTKIFMSSFYRKVLDGNSYSSALREAKLKMISDPETTFPTIWAVFVLWSD